jgi:hypothetical protein
MRPTAIATAGFLFLGLLFSAVFYIQGALFGLGLLVCLPVALGFLWNGHRVRRFWIPGRAGIDPDDNAVGTNIQIEGRNFLISALPLRLNFVVSCRNMRILAAVAVLAIMSVLTCAITGFLGESLEPDNPRYLLAYSLCFLVGLLLFPAWIWLGECFLLRMPGITLALIHARSRGGLGTRWISYGFVDPLGSHHGGSVIDFGGPEDDHFKVVLCDRLDPGRNKLSSGLLFHRLQWADEPSD